MNKLKPPLANSSTDSRKKQLNQVTVTNHFTLQILKQQSRTDAYIFSYHELKPSPLKEDSNVQDRLAKEILTSVQYVR